jgi:hypothetical protein
MRNRTPATQQRWVRSSPLMAMWKVKSPKTSCCGKAEASCRPQLCRQSLATACTTSKTVPHWSLFDAKTGELVGQKKLGRIMFGSPMVADGKIYIAENTGRFYVLKPSEKEWTLSAKLDWGRVKKSLVRRLLRMVASFCLPLKLCTALVKPDAPPTKTSRSKLADEQAAS